MTSSSHPCFSRCVLQLSPLYVIGTWRAVMLVPCSFRWPLCLSDTSHLTASWNPHIMASGSLLGLEMLHWAWGGCLERYVLILNNLCCLLTQPHTESFNGLVVRITERHRDKAGLGSTLWETLLWCQNSEPLTLSYGLKACVFSPESHWDAEQYV